jgi:hypothetical protein
MNDSFVPVFEEVGYIFWFTVMPKIPKYLFVSPSFACFELTNVSLIESLALGID